MNPLDRRLDPFARRVRWLQAWKGLALGGTLGGGVSLLLAILDFARALTVNWVALAVPVIVGLIGGALWGFFRSPSSTALADSIDRRANLKERLSTAREAHDEAFGDEQRADTLAHLSSLKPAEIYPMRVSGWHAGPVASFGAAAAVFMVGSQGLLLTPQAKAERAELKKEGVALEKVARPVLDRPSEEVGKEERLLAERLDRMAKEMQRGRLSKEQAMQTKNEIAQKLEDQKQERFAQSEQSVFKAQTMMEKLAIREAEKRNELTGKQAQELMKQLEQADSKAGQDASGLPQEMRELQRQLNSGRDAQGNPLSQEQRQQIQSRLREMDETMRELQEQIAEMTKSLQTGQDGSGKQLSKAELEQLQKNLEANKELLEKMKLSKEAQEFLKKLSQQPEFKELMEMAQKLQQNADAAQRGEQPPITEEQIKEMMKRLDEMAEKFKDDAAMKELIEQMKEAMKNGCYG